jgi:hypothetical protein
MRFVRWIIVSLGVALLGLPLLAATPSVAVVQVTAADIEIQRGDTGNWLPLPETAEMPLGTGDSIRSLYPNGRAILRLGETAHILLLPNSTLTFTTLEQNDAGAWVVAVEQRGQAIYHTPDRADFAVYTVTQGTHTVSLGEESAVYVEDSGRMTVVALRGEMTLNDDLLIPPQNAVRVDTQPSELVPFRTPGGFAQVEAQLDGCPGAVDTRVPGNLNVRTFVGINSYAMGTYTRGTPVQIIGILPVTPFPWYRVQFQGDFGWVTSDSVITECSDLPVYENIGPRLPLGLNDLLPEEVALLEPLFGTPEEDTWIYRTLREAAS